MYRTICFAITATVLAACYGPATADESYVEAGNTVRACIDENLVSVERAFDDLYFASEFLLNKVCTSELTDAAEAYQDENENRLNAVLTKKCGPLVEVESETFNVFSEIDFDQSQKNAQARRVRACHANNGFNRIRPETAAYDGLESIFVVMTAYTSKRLLNLRIARLDDKPTGDK